MPHNYTFKNNLCMGGYGVHHCSMFGNRDLFHNEWQANILETNLDNRSGKLNWCKSDQCVVMTTHQENVCCHLVKKVKK
jgi:hypothetical protein